MAGRQDIKAGAAYVNLYVKDSALVKGLNAAAQKLKSFGAGIAKIGAGMTAMGGAVLTPLLAMAKGFAEAGSALADMSARTGVGVETLSALGYAAGMTGASIEDVEKALSKMARAGIGADQLGAIADKLAAMTNPAKRTAYAIATMGKGGAALIPMLSGGAAGLAEFRAEAERLGIVMSSEDASAADLLGDAMDKVKAGLGGVRNQIGAALAPALTFLAEQLATGIARVIQFVKANRELVVGIAAGAAAVVAGGAVLTALGGAIALAGMALSGLATILGVVLSPLGLLVIGLTAGVAGFITFTETGQWLANTLMGDFATAFDTVKQTIAGITDALKAGEFRLAGEIAMTGLKLAFFEGTKSIRAMWIDFNKAVVAFTIEAAKSVIKAWMWASQVIAGWLANLGYQINLLLAGQTDVLTDAERLDAMTSSLTNYYDTLASGLIGTVDEMGTAIQDTLDANLTDGEARIAALRAELAGLTGVAAARLAALPATAPPGATKPGGIDTGAKDMTAASFSSTALVALGQGGGVMPKLLNAAQERNRIAKLELEELKKIRAQGGAMSMLLLP